MPYIILLLIIVNLLTCWLSIDPLIPLIIIAISLSTYRGLKADKFKDIYNIGNFNYKPNKKNIIELLCSFICGVIACQAIKDFNISDIIFYIIFSLIIYRFSFYNLSDLIQKTSKRYDNK